MARVKPSKNATIRTLQALDLSENEALLYAQMLSEPENTVQELAIATPFPRTMLYYILKQLSAKGLVRLKKDAWRTVYIAEDPDHLYHLLSKKERDFGKDMASVKEAIPRLRRQYRLSNTRPSIRTFEGVVEYQKALEDMLLTQPNEVLSFETLGKKRPALEIRRHYDGKRVARKIKKRILFFEDEQALKELKARKYDDYTEYRAIAKASVLPFSSDVKLYDGKLLYTTYDEREPTVLMVEDRALYEMQKNLFEKLWKEGTDRTLAYFEKV